LPSGCGFGIGGNMNVGAVNRILAKVYVSPSERRAAKRQIRGKPLTLAEWDRLRNRVAAVTCSAYWEDFALLEADRQGITPACRKVPELLQRYQIFPPPAENTPMRSCRCPNCRSVRLWPAGFVNSRGYSTECALEMSCRDDDDADALN
jgi:hypothetical protein